MYKYTMYIYIHAVHIYILIFTSSYKSNEIHVESIFNASTIFQLNEYLFTQLTLYIYIKYISWYYTGVLNYVT